MEAYYKRHLDKYAEEIASYAQNGHENYIAFTNEKNYPSGEGIHMVDNYSIFRNALVLKPALRQYIHSYPEHSHRLHIE